MASLDSMVLFFKRSKRPFYFPLKRPRFIRFSGQSFAFDYNFIGRFFYVLLEVGLKNQIVYKVPNFLQKIKAVYQGMKLPYFQEDVFLFRGSYAFGMPFSSFSVGYFPISFYNSIFLGVGFSKYSFGHHSLLTKRSLLKATMERVLATVDSHLSMLFSRKPISFPKVTNFTASFKFSMGQIFLISGDHNVSSYTARAEGPFLKFGGVSFRRYRDSFFKGFFRHLRLFFLGQLFTLSRGSLRPLEVLSFVFDHFYKVIYRVVNYLRYLKLFLGSFIFSFHGFFASLKYFIVEILHLLDSQGEPLDSFVKFSFFRNFFFFFTRLFLFSGVFRDLFSAASSLKFSRVPLFNDLFFFRGLRLNRSFSLGRSREFFSRAIFSKGLKPKKRLPLWRDNLGPAMGKKKRPWVTYIAGYFRKQRQKAALARWLRSRAGPRDVFSSSSLSLLLPIAREQLPVTGDPYALATHLYESSLVQLGYGGYRYFDAASRIVRSGAWQDFRFSLLRTAFAVCNERAAMRYMLAKKNLVSLRARALALAKKADRPLRLLLGAEAARFLMQPLAEPSRFKGKFFFSGRRQTVRKLPFPKPVHLGKRFAAKVNSYPLFRRRPVFLPATSSGLVLERSVAFFPRSPFVLLTKSFFLYLLFFFGRGSLARLPLAKPRPFYVLRREFFNALWAKLSKARLFVKLSFPWIASGLSASVFSLATPGKRNFLRRRATWALRRKAKVSKTLVRKLSGRRVSISFSSYRFCYFFNSSLFPFTFQRFFPYGARFFFLNWTFKSARVMGIFRSAPGVSLSLALKVYFLFAFTQFVFLGEHMLSFLFSLLKSFFTAGSVALRGYGYFRKFFKLFFSTKLRSFLLHQRAGKKYITEPGFRNGRLFQRNLPGRVSSLVPLAQDPLHKDKGTPRPSVGKASENISGSPSGKRKRPRRKKKRGGPKPKDTVPVVPGGIARDLGSSPKVQGESFGTHELKRR